MWPVCLPPLVVDLGAAAVATAKTVKHSSLLGGAAVLWPGAGSAAAGGAYTGTPGGGERPVPIPKCT